MRYRIQQIKLNIEEKKDKLPEKIKKKLGRKDIELINWEIVKESIDARDKSDIKLVYTVDFDCNKPLKLGGKPKLELAPDMTYAQVSSGDETIEGRPVVVGFGPCGMFCALILASQGYRPIVVERGSNVEKRAEDVKKFWEKGALNTESNVQFGEGGAGTFSDGKLTTGIKDPRIRKVLTEFVEAGADPDILYKQKPHIGTDVLRVVVKNIREKIISLGGEVIFDTKLIGIGLTDGQVKSVTLETADGQQKTIETSVLVTAIGHSARDTFRYLNSIGVEMKQKPFSMGVRVEHPQEIIDRSQYGNCKLLSPADYKLSCHLENGRGVYTFCMCPGGEVIIASSQEGMVVTNGMSNRARNSGVANSALLVDVRPEDFGSEHPLAGVDFQEKYEKLAFENGGCTYKAPKTLWKDFRDDAQASMAVQKSLPDFVVAGLKEAMPIFGRKIKGFDADDAIMTAVESRSSSPVRFARSETGEGTFVGLYPAGEGAGYAGGITSAACDGIKVAEKIIKKYRPIG